MRSTFAGLEIAKRALFAQQSALQVTGHNISNANTEGYSRQTIDFRASRPLEYPGLTKSAVPGQIGQGVEFDHISRMREKFLDDQFNTENQAFGEWGVRKDTLDKLEAIFNEPSDSGISKVVDGFWNTWQVVSREPENLTARAALKEAALSMTDAFNATGKKLDDLTVDINESMNVRVVDINSYTKQIAQLNVDIARIEGLGDKANDLRDQRDLQVTKLSKLINVSVREDQQGYNVTMGGQSLVSSSSGATEVTADSLVAAASGGDLKSGELYGLIYSRDNYLPAYKFQLDSMIKAIVQGKISITLPKDTVVPDGTVINGVTYSGTVNSRRLPADTTFEVKGLNGVHMLGYTLDDPPQTGIPFFTLKGGATDFGANTVTVNPDILKKVSNIATSARVELDSSGNEKTVRGNNEIALAIAGLRNSKLSFDPASNGTPLLTSGTFDEFFRAVVGQLGVQSQEATRQVDNQTVLVDQVESRRQSVSGVSLDEEMANMIKYQHAYNAAARALTMFDEVLDKLINGTGVTR